MQPNAQPNLVGWYPSRVVVAADHLGRETHVFYFPSCVCVPDDTHISLSTPLRIHAVDPLGLSAVCRTQGVVCTALNDGCQEYDRSEGPFFMISPLPCYALRLRFCVKHSADCSTASFAEERPGVRGLRATDVVIHH